jgi:hypothetical protein
MFTGNYERKRTLATIEGNQLLLASTIRAGSGGVDYVRNATGTPYAHSLSRLCAENGPGRAAPAVPDHLDRAGRPACPGDGTQPLHRHPGRRRAGIVPAGARDRTGRADRARAGRPAAARHRGRDAAAGGRAAGHDGHRPGRDRARGAARRVRRRRAIRQGQHGQRVPDDGDADRHRPAVLRLSPGAHHPAVAARAGRVTCRDARLIRRAPARTAPPGGRARPPEPGRAGRASAGCA